MQWRRKWQPTPVFLPGQSQGREAWWAAVYGVAQSQTWLKRRSSNSSSNKRRWRRKKRIRNRDFVWSRKPKIFTIWPFGAKVWYNQIIEYLSDHQKMRNQGSNGWSQAVKLTNLPYSSHLSGLSANSTWRYKVPNFPLKFQEAFLKWASFKKKQTLIPSDCLNWSLSLASGSLLLSTDKCWYYKIIASRDWENPKDSRGLSKVNGSGKILNCVILSHKKTQADIFLFSNATLTINSTLQLTKCRQSQQLNLCFHMWKPESALEPQSPDCKESCLHYFHLQTPTKRSWIAVNKNIKTCRRRKLQNHSYCCTEKSINLEER